MLDAPLTVRTFTDLARSGYFGGVAIHRVVPNFVVQDGDPRGDGEGGPGYTIRDELNQRPCLRGTVGMALSGKDTSTRLDRTAPISTAYISIRSTCARRSSTRCPTSANGR